MVAQGSMKEVVFVVKLQQNRGMLQQTKHTTANLMLVNVPVINLDSKIILVSFFNQTINSNFLTFDILNKYWQA